MWLGCEKGVKEDWRLMKKYNKQDVVLEDLVVEKLLPFMKQVNHYAGINKDNITCPNPLCGSTHLIKHRRSVIKGGFWRQKYQCQKCGQYYTDSSKKYKIID